MSRVFFSSTTFSAGFGSKNSIVGDANYITGSVYDSANDKIIIAYRDGNNSNYGTAVIGSISGARLLLELPWFLVRQLKHTETIYDSSSGKVVILFYKNDTAISAIVGTVSGTSISFGSIVFNSRNTPMDTSMFQVRLWK